MATALADCDEHLEGVWNILRGWGFSSRLGRKDAIPKECSYGRGTNCLERFRQQPQDALSVCLWEFSLGEERVAGGVPPSIRVYIT